MDKIYKVLITIDYSYNLRHLNPSKSILSDD